MAAPGTKPRARAGERGGGASSCIRAAIVISDTDDSDVFEWEIDGEAETSSAAALRNFDAPGPSMPVRQVDAKGWVNEKASSDVVEKYVRMGFLKEHVLKGIKEIGHNDADELLNHLLTYKLIDDDCAGCCSTSGCAPLSVEDNSEDDLDFDWDSEEDAGGGGEDFLQEMADKDDKIKVLQEMGFPGDEADRAITICGNLSSI